MSKSKIRTPLGMVSHMVSKPQTAAMHPGPGFRIRTDVDRPSAETVQALGSFDTPQISDLMNRLYALEPTIRNLTDDRLPLVGPACTVKVYPGRQPDGSQVARRRAAR